MPIRKPPGDRSPSAVELTYTILYDPSTTVEMRGLGAQYGVISGYFTNGASLAAEVDRLNNKGANFYVTINPVEPDLLARSANKAKQPTKHTTTDTDIMERRYLMIDLDPERPKGVSSTEGEHQAAIDLAGKVSDWLGQQGWPEPILADSGNGAHLLYRISLPNDLAATDLIKHCLKALAKRFDYDAVKVDTSTYNAARTTRLYGTINRKGDDLPERPHRVSSLLRVPAVINPVPQENLEALASEATKGSRSHSASTSHSAQVATEPTFDLGSWLEKQGLEVASEGPWQGGTKYVLAVCPFNPEHDDRSAYVVQLPSGRVAAGCHHNSCKSYTWEDLRDRVEPGWRPKSGDSNRSASKSGGGDKESVPETLMRLAEPVYLFHDGAGTAFARVPVRDHLEVYPVRGDAFPRWLKYQYYREKGKVVAVEALEAVAGVLESKAVYEGEGRPLGYRVAVLDDDYWYDLADDRWRAIHITSGGWEVVDSPPALFTRSGNIAPQVKPVEGGNLRDLLKFVRLRNEQDEVLFLVFLVACMIPGIPYPVGILFGPKGATKSTTTRVFRSLVDPAIVPILKLPRDLESIRMNLRSGHLMCYDNIGALTADQSDLLCTASTVGGDLRRKLYTDGDVSLATFRRPVLLNGINVPTAQSDLLDRALLLELERIEPGDRRDETTFWADFELQRPLLLGAALDAVVGAMKIYPDVQLSELPRMADFCRWGCAIAEAIGFGGEAFLNAYYRNIDAVNDEVVETVPLAAAVRALMRDRREWSGMASDLLGSLIEAAQDELIDIRVYSWPKAPNALTRRLKEIRSNLRAVGIEVEQSKTPTGSHYRLENVKYAAPQSHTRHPTEPTLDLEL